MINEYGKLYIMQTDEGKEHYVKVMQKRYQADNPSQVPEFQAKKVVTCLENRQTEYPGQCPLVQQTCANTCMELYEVPYPMQNAEIAERSGKNAFNLKEFIFPSGVVVKVQGYEPFGLRDLIELYNVQEEDIVLGRNKVPTIHYKDNDGKDHRHFVDIWLPQENTMIEIKSTRTLALNFDIVFLKQTAAKAAGYQYEIWVYNDKGKRLETYL